MDKISKINCKAHFQCLCDFNTPTTKDDKQTNIQVNKRLDHQQTDEEKEKLLEGLTG